MFVWVGIEVEDQLLELKSLVDAFDENTDYTSCKLPLHISLKISFDVEKGKFDTVISDIEQLILSYKPFYIKVRGIEHHSNIIWVRMERNEIVDSLHDRLNSLMLEKYGVPLHEYDLDYIFHTTLFMDDDAEKINRAYESVKNCTLPEQLLLKKCLIGSSDSGKNGTYSVYKEILM